MGWNGWSSSDDIYETACIGLTDIGKATCDTLVEIKVSKRCAVIGAEGQGGRRIKKIYPGLIFFFKPCRLDLPTDAIRHMSIYSNMTSLL